MTATVSTGPDVASVLKRADARYNHRRGDDPAPSEYLDALVLAVNPLLDQMRRGGATPSDAELVKLREENGDLADEVARLTKALATQTPEVHRLTVALDELAAEARNATANLTEHARLLEERDGQVRELRHLVDELEAAQRAAVPAEPHRHQYVWPEPGTAPAPCACGQPYPRTNITKAKAPKATTPEPFAALFSRVRGQLAGWPAASS